MSSYDQPLDFSKHASNTLQSLGDSVRDFISSMTGNVYGMYASFILAALTLYLISYPFSYQGLPVGKNWSKFFDSLSSIGLQSLTLIPALSSLSADSSYAANYAYFSGALILLGYGTTAMLPAIEESKGSKSRGYYFMEALGTGLIAAGTSAGVGAIILVAKPAA